MVTRRQQRLNQLLREELSNLLRHETDDPALSSLISITGVEVSQDLEHAKVFVSIFEEEEQARQTLQRLRRAARFFRRALAERLNLRHTPVLDFQLDTSIARGTRVLQLIREVSPKE